MRSLIALSISVFVLLGSLIYLVIWDSHANVIPNDKMNTVASSEGGNRIVWITDDRKVRVWDASRKSIQFEERFDESETGDLVAGVIEADDTLVLCSASGDWCSRWHYFTKVKKQSAQPPLNRAYLWGSTPVDADTMLSWTTDNIFTLWSLNTGKVIRKTKAPFSDVAGHVFALSPLGKKIAIFAETTPFRGWQLCVLNVPDLTIDCFVSIRSNIEDDEVRVAMGFATGCCTNGNWNAIGEAITSRDRVMLRYRASVCGLGFSQDETRVVAGTMRRLLVVNREAQSVERELVPAGDAVLKNVLVIGLKNAICAEAWRGQRYRCGFGSGEFTPTDLSALWPLDNVCRFWLCNR